MKNNYEGKYYIVRGENSGVFAGEIEERNGREVKIKNCRRIWYWDGACSLSEMALRGVKKPGNCKFTVEVASVEILDAIEILECTDEAKENIKGVRVWHY